MILHIFPDEKFIDMAIDNFERVYPGRHKYLVGIDNKYVEIKHIKKNIDKVLIAAYGSSEFYYLMGNLLEYEAVVLHYLDKPKSEIIKNSPEGVNFVWNSWGGDIYNGLSSCRYKLYGRTTKRLFLKSISKNIFEYYLRISIPFELIRIVRAEVSLKKIRMAVCKINYFSTVLPPEKQFIYKHFHIRGRYIDYNYASKDFFNMEIYNKINSNVKVSKNILLGNSAAPTNNHIEVINLLSTFNIGENKVYVPLSYGANENYISEINKHGTELLGQNYFPLNTMLPIKEYYDLISSCTVCIMNHYRQNGMGNVIFMLWLGAKVFLSERNPAYIYFIELGVIVFSIEKELTNSSNLYIFDELPNFIKSSNKSILEKQFGYELILKRIENFVNVITQKTQD